VVTILADFGNVFHATSCIKFQEHLSAWNTIKVAARSLNVAEFFTLKGAFRELSRRWQWPGALVMKHAACHSVTLNVKIVGDFRHWKDIRRPRHPLREQTSLPTWHLQLHMATDRGCHFNFMATWGQIVIYGLGPFKSLVTWHALLYVTALSVFESNRFVTLGHVIH
jgi:hypothetical protein